MTDGVRVADAAHRAESLSAESALRFGEIFTRKYDFPPLRDRASATRSGQRSAKAPSIHPTGGDSREHCCVSQGVIEPAFVLTPEAFCRVEQVSGGNGLPFHGNLRAG